MTVSRFIAILTFVSAGVQAQVLEKLTVEKIMRDPKWIGVAPTSPYWSPDSKTLYFNWNPEAALSDSLYTYGVSSKSIRKATAAERSSSTSRVVQYNSNFTRAVYEKNGDIFMVDLVGNKTIQVTNTTGNEFGPQFSGDDKSVIFSSGMNLYRWTIASGTFVQLTDFKTGSKPGKSTSDQESWLKADQLMYFKVLNERNAKSEQRKKQLKKEIPKHPKEIYVDEKSVELTRLSPDQKYVTYRLSKKTSSKTTIVPNYVTASGFTEDISARTKVGVAPSPGDFYLYDIAGDTTYLIKLSDIPGISDSLSYANDYPAAKRKKLKQRDAEVSSVEWSPDGKHCVLSVSALDFKDSWLMELDPATRKLSLIHREHDDAWVDSPVSDFFGNDNMGWLGDNKRLWFISEETGYAHLYTINVETKEQRQLTSGNFEIQKVVLNRARQQFYVITNESNPGEKQLYRLSVEGSGRTRLTPMSGAYEFELSPDEKFIALRYSYSNKPWELQVLENKPNAKPVQITNSLTTEFKSYPWRDPEVVTFEARDKAKVYARLYKPANPNGAGVVFVHGAGYLQNAHKWWSSYFREYMFHNLLTDLGYTVLDIDYRASAGYGRDWRTGIYRFMGGKDLTDNLDGAALLVSKYNVDPKRVGVYGGSYGGFITLMAMFTAPDVFAAGAALRPVTDWAHYNHPYTGAILNTPYLDSLSYAKSSPIYHAEGLKGALLICHGMVDVNVHFQDAVRLTQRLIELGKDNWELAAYPMEDHAFVEPSSWTDEYKRILKLFETNLKAAPLK
ncbi:prolyl oligopeptidase family serine peptidase [Chryseolinea sp. T2]|uniref:prolyl oligopeptidase family serine peptidase n=1 Tax=Chryseolinea sp. T2 TaxID=3129255 RepID=UPI003076A329